MKLVRTTSVITVALCLACGGLQDEPPTPSLPALVMPVADGEGCAVKNLQTQAVLTKFDFPCNRWSITANPKNPDDVLIRMDRGDEGTEIQRGGKALPPVPHDVDAAGFDADGAVVVFTDESIDEKLTDDARAGVSWVEVDGKRLEVPYDPERMFGVVACRALALDGDAWKPAADPGLVELFEGMSQPWCVRRDDFPALAPILAPGQEEAAPVETSALDVVPPALEAIPHDENNGWVLLEPLGIAVGMMWFEGERLQEPVVRREGEGWVALEGFDARQEYSRPVQLFQRGDHLLVCTRDEAHLYQRSASYARVWTSLGLCPVFWPLEG